MALSKGWDGMAGSPGGHRRLGVHDWMGWVDRLIGFSSRALFVLLRGPFAMWDGFEDLGIL